MSRSSRQLGLPVLVLCALAGCASENDLLERHSYPYSLTPEQREALKDYPESQLPGEHHRNLDPLVGRFSATVTQWLEDGQPPMESTGVLENTWVLGGRFVQSLYRSDGPGPAFEGQGLLGYDTVRQRYVGNWADSMGTFLWPVGTGECSDDGKAFTLTRVMTDPMTGGLVKIRDVTTIVDDDHITYEMFATHPGTDEFKMLEAHYTRT
jgi:hypothetical protein